MPESHPPPGVQLENDLVLKVQVIFKRTGPNMTLDSCDAYDPTPTSELAPITQNDWLT